MSRAVIVEADGGSRGNPGPAGYGAVVFDADTGEVLAERKQSIGIETNNVAEYQGLIAGLTAAAELGAASVAVRMDSKLVVEQMSGRWQVKHPSMRPLAREVTELKRRFDTITFEWIPRELNKHADRLANEAMDAAARRADSTGREAWRPASAVEQLELQPSNDGRDVGGATAVGAPQAPVQPKLVEPTPQSAWVPPNTVPTRLILLRHGVTDDTIRKVFAGRSDPELNVEGLMQVARAAVRVAELGPIDAIVASPLRRTRATAQAVADVTGLPISVEPGFVETNFGDWDGYSFGEVSQRWPEAMRRWMDDETLAPPGGESFETVTARVGQARDALLKSRPEQTIVVCTHVTPIKVLVRLALQAPPSALHRMFLTPASVTVIDYYSDGPVSLRSFNDTAHL